MPLPAALLARLKKRGIIQKESSGFQDPEEEVIAEDYDDKTGSSLSETDDRISKSAAETKQISSVPGCPNKWNIFHVCSRFCLKRWGNGKKHPSPRSNRKRLKMLMKYPLPENWEEAYDPGTGRHYYWNFMTQQVCWLSPNHPRAAITLPAEKLRAVLNVTDVKTTTERPTQGPVEKVVEKDLSSSDSSGDEDMEEHEEEIKIRKPRWEIAKEKKGQRKVRENDLDPMDPASYSDIPRGTWSTGLDKKGEAKTGADTTASGPLYQMRPYPSPGAILRMNAGGKKDAKKDSGSEDEDEEQ